MLSCELNMKEIFAWFGTRRRARALGLKMVYTVYWKFTTLAVK